MKDKAEGVIIRILMKEDGPLNNLVETIFSQLPNVQVLQSISINAKVVTMIIDRHKILSIEIADSSQHDILNTVGLALIQTADPLYNPPTQYLKCSGYRGRIKKVLKHINKTDRLFAAINSSIDTSRLHQI